jgi:hypothetical protein
VSHGYSGPSFPVWRRREWLVIPGGMIVTVALGTWGYQWYAGLHREHAAFLSSVYGALQLFLLHMPHLEPPVPWPLEIARFVAPLVLGYGAVQTFFRTSRHLWHRRGLSSWRGHVVVCGLSRKALQLVLEFRAAGDKVVVIERDRDHPFLPAVHDAGAAVLHGDATEEAMLARAGVARCGTLVAVTDSDGANIEVAMRARWMVECAGTSDSCIRCFVHVAKRRLRDELRAAPWQEQPGHALYRVIGIDPHAGSARLLFDDCPLDWAPIGPGDAAQAHLVVVSFGHAALAVVRQALQVAHFANGKRPRITVVHDVTYARPAMDTLRALVPAIDDVCDLGSMSFRPREPGLTARLATLCREPGTLPTVVFCHRDEEWNVPHAMKLRRLLGDTGATVAARVPSWRGLTLLTDTTRVGGDRVTDVRPFGMLEEIYSSAALFEDQLDRIANGIHEQFLGKARAEGRTADTDSALREWPNLPEVYRDSCRRQADHIPVKLRAIGRPWPAEGPIAPFTAAEVELLSRMEHARWCTERRLAGWTYAPGEKDEAARTSPHLVPWEALDEPIREYDRVAVRGIEGLEIGGA